jgi:hypothetical protein
MLNTQEIVSTDGEGNGNITDKDLDTRKGTGNGAITDFIIFGDHGPSEAGTRNQQQMGNGDPCGRPTCERDYSVMNAATAFCFPDQWQRDKPVSFLF